MDDIYAVGDGTMGCGHWAALSPWPDPNRGGASSDAIADAEQGEATARPIPKPPQATVIRIGSLTAAMTGAGPRYPDASGAEYFLTVHTHANQHAGYFPGAKPVQYLMHVGTGGQDWRASRGQSMV